MHVCRFTCNLSLRDCPLASFPLSSSPPPLYLITYQCFPETDALNLKTIRETNLDSQIFEHGQANKTTLISINLLIIPQNTRHKEMTPFLGVPSHGL